MLSKVLHCSTLILGCGNPLFGDDGFGPAVIDHLSSHYRLPDHVAAVDVGTSMGSFLVDLLLFPRKPRRIFILDAVSDSGRRPGELFEISLSSLSGKDTTVITLHEFPSAQVLQELEQQARVQVRILVVQAQSIPKEVSTGISPAVQAAIPQACLWLYRQVEECP